MKLFLLDLGLLAEEATRIDRDSWPRSHLVPTTSCADPPHRLIAHIAISIALVVVLICLMSR
jgi:hypothetical protein